MTSEFSFGYDDGYCYYKFSILVDEKYSTLPEEFLVEGYKSGGALILRKGDSVIVEGKILKEFKGKSNLEYIWMQPSHIYNSTLKCGF